MQKWTGLKSEHQITIPFFTNTFQTLNIKAITSGKGQSSFISVSSLLLTLHVSVHVHALGLTHTCSECVTDFISQMWYKWSLWQSYACVRAIGITPSYFCSAFMADFIYQILFKCCLWQSYPCVCVCVCVCEREREREWEAVHVCVCVCVCVCVLVCVCACLCVCEWVSMFFLHHIYALVPGLHFCVKIVRFMPDLLIFFDK